MPLESTYNDNQAELILEGLEAGLSLRKICRDNANLPDRATVLRWQHANPDFAAKCARAREAGAEIHHDDMDDIEAGVLDGTIEAKAANVVLANKRWRLEKLKPRVFGARVAHELSGPGGGPVAMVGGSMTPEQAAEAYAATLRGTGG